MPEPLFPRREVERSFRKFRDLVEDLQRTNISTWDNAFRHFMNHCESDPVMRTIVQPLRDNRATDVEKWMACANDTRDFMLPDGDEDRLALIYQLFLEVHEGRLNTHSLGFLVEWGAESYEIVPAINDNLVTPFVREVNYRLDDIVADKAGDPTFSREDLTVFHHHGDVHYVQTITGDNNVVAAGIGIAQDARIRVNAGDGDALSRELAEIGLTKQQIGALMEAIGKDGVPRDRRLGEKVGAWFGGIIQSAATGAGNIAIATAPALIQTAIEGYYGWK